MMSKVLSLACAALMLAACASDAEDAPATVQAPPQPVATQASQPATTQTAQAGTPGGSVFDWFGPGAPADKRTGVAVNRHLWRASLDTLSFAPMETADPFGGVIKTGWYTPTPNERMRIAVYILDSRLRADALRVSVFKEVKKPTGDWVDGTVDPETVTKLENLILNKARDLKQDGD
jgi:hypothetical protein